MGDVARAEGHDAVTREQHGIASAVCPCAIGNLWGALMCMALVFLHMHMHQT